MKKLVVVVVTLALFGAINTINAQSNPKTIKLEQTPGEFSIKGLTLDSGKYVFEIKNNGVDHQIGFIITPKGKETMEHAVEGTFIKNGGKGLEDGESAMTGVVTLGKGTYAYWCPMNPTEKNYIIVR